MMTWFALGVFGWCALALLTGRFVSFNTRPERRGLPIPRRPDTQTEEN